MGQGGYITLVNSTVSNWTKKDQNSYQMNSWNFPDTINAGTSVNVYVEWNQNIFNTQSDDGGGVSYTLEDAVGSTFQVQASASNGFQLKICFVNLQTNGNPKGSTINLGWNHDGYVDFILSGKAGNYTSTNLNAADWMSDNLNLLGAKKMNEFCITGSHDSGMSVYTSGTAFSAECNTLTQSNNIQKQMELGARYFDIRPVISAGKYYAGHYSNVKQISSWQGANGQSIQSIIADVNSFTTNHKELIILNLSHSLNTDVGNSSYRDFTQEEWNNLFAELKNIDNLHVVKDNPDIDLTKLVLNDFISNKAAVVIVVEATVDLGSYEGNGFYLYKNFNVYNSYAGSNDVNTMSNDQLTKMQDQTGKSYFLLSWTLTQNNTEVTTCSLGTASSIKDLANNANQHLAEMVYPKVSKSDYPNIIYVDNIVNSDSAAMAMAVNWKLE